MAIDCQLLPSFQDNIEKKAAKRKGTGNRLPVPFQRVPAMKENVLQKSVKATLGAFEEKVKQLSADQDEDKLASLQAYVNKQVELRLDLIRIEDNVRRGLDTHSEKFQELVASIRKHGLLQNLVVELRYEEGRHQLFCVAGQRRLLAALEAETQAAATEGRERKTLTAACLIKQFQSPAERLAAGLAENLTREDLSCLDIAAGYAGLLEHGWTEEQIAQLFERNPRTIRRYVAIAAWPAEILALLREHQEIFTTKVIFNELIARRFPSVTDFRAYILQKVAQKQTPTKSSPRLPRWRQFEASLEQQLKLKVRVQGTEETGKVTIDYQDAGQLEKIKQLLLSTKAQ
jgi:ParB/RepB/Spo0J family partition protein